jgi:hypothetical protein
MEHLAEPKGDAAAVCEARAGSGIEVEHDVGGLVQRVGGGREGVQLDRAEVHDPQERRQVVDHALLANFA